MSCKETAPRKYKSQPNTAQLWRDNDKSSVKGTSFQAVVPFKARRQILAYSNDHKTAGHLGVRKTLSKIRQQYYWPGLQKDVRHYIIGCEICSKSKCSTKKQKSSYENFRCRYSNGENCFGHSGRIAKNRRWQQVQTGNL